MMSNALAAFKEYRGKENTFQFENSKSNRTSTKAIVCFVNAAFNETAIIVMNDYRGHLDAEIRSAMKKILIQATYG